MDYCFRNFRIISRHLNQSSYKYFTWMKDCGRFAVIEYASKGILLWKIGTFCFLVKLIAHGRSGDLAQYSLSWYHLNLTDCLNVVESFITVECGLGHFLFICKCYFEGPSCAQNLSNREYFCQCECTVGRGCCLILAVQMTWGAIARRKYPLRQLLHQIHVLLSHPKKLSVSLNI